MLPPLTSQQIMHTKLASTPSSEKMDKSSKPQQDKPLNCDLLETVNKDISAVLVYRDPKNQLQLIEIAREKVINIAPEEFVNKFGEQPPVAYSCVQLIPTITTRPLVTDIDRDHRLDLIYAVDYVTQKPATGPTRMITHLMKLRKVDISSAISKKHNRKLSTKLYRSDRKNYKRNENFDSPFLTWNT
ncbi:uncharacterized protein LOC114574261 [Exaiptasia diaphana]|nr:uncharacterized protein LOC114574261 [Exaiptasia diaphana]